MSTNNLALFEPTQLVLEFTDASREQAWNVSQVAASPSSRWQIYLNQLTLDVILPWLESAQNEVVRDTFNPSDRANLAELVNGTTITLGAAQLVLIPTEAADLTELRVPQEWVDIPELVADYYLAVQVNVDDNFIRVWGYTTHRQLKARSIYNSSDRAYSLDETDLITDLDVLWVARELCPDEVTQAEVQPLAAMSATQAENLIQRLGSNDELLPRLAIPFSLWGALMQNRTWRQRLVAQRRGLPEIKVSVVQWLETGLANLAAEFGWKQVEFQPSMVGAKGTILEDTQEIIKSSTALVKQMEIAHLPYELKIFLLDLQGQENIWRFELRSLTVGGMIPVGFKLRLLTEDGESFPDNEDQALNPVELLYLEISLESGEGLIWQVEPTPQNYQPEVLHF